MEKLMQNTYKYLLQIWCGIQDTRIRVIANREDTQL